jgi:hypothetical protein
MPAVHTRVGYILPKERLGTCFELATCRKPIMGNNGFNSEEPLNEPIATLLTENSKTMGAILRAGALCGAMDITAAFVVYGFFGARPVPILQGIASGLLGSRAFDGGLPIAFLGLCFHFFIAFTAACVYVLLARRLDLLVQYVYFSGSFYGVAVYFFMQIIVIPLSAVTKRPFSLKGMLIGIVIHIFCVGLPISLVTRRYLST